MLHSFRATAFVALLASILLLIPPPAHALFGGKRTGGMSEISLDETRIKVDGGFIESADKGSLSVRAKGLEVSLNIDNSASKEDKDIAFTVGNVDPQAVQIMGWSEGEIKKSANALSFSVHIKANKVAVYKLTPVTAEEGFKFVVFGESQGGEPVFKRILGDINYRKPLFAIGCGDMVEEPSDGGFRDFLKAVEAVSVPFLTVAGGSEVGEGSRRLYEEYLGLPYYSFDFRTAHFIILDDGDGRLGEAQFRWLEEDLMQNKAINTFVFMHHPPFDPRPSRPSPLDTGDQGRRLMSLLERYHVSMVFSSGIHGYFREERGGVPYVITGGGGSPLAAADAFYNYVIVEVAGDKAKDKLIKLPSPTLAWYAALTMKVQLYAKNSFAAHPVWTTILGLILALVLLVFLNGVWGRIARPSRKRKISL